jgi:hypothetical protein
MLCKIDFRVVNVKRIVWGYIYVADLTTQIRLVRLCCCSMLMEMSVLNALLLIVLVAFGKAYVVRM